MTGQRRSKRTRIAQKDHHEGLRGCFSDPTAVKPPTMAWRVASVSLFTVKEASQAFSRICSGAQSKSKRAAFDIANNALANGRRPGRVAM
jgi:hypothetical protein